MFWTSDTIGQIFHPLDRMCIQGTGRILSVCIKSANVAGISVLCFWMEIRTWISNYINLKQRDVVSPPYFNFIGGVGKLPLVMVMAPMNDYIRTHFVYKNMLVSTGSHHRLTAIGLYTVFAPNMRQSIINPIKTLSSRRICLFLSGEKLKDWDKYSKQHDSIQMHDIRHTLQFLCIAVLTWYQLLICMLGDLC